MGTRGSLAQLLCSVDPKRPYPALEVIKGTSDAQAGLFHYMSGRDL